MKIKRIPKGRGEYRTVYVPSPREKRALLALVPGLAALAARLDVHGVSHAFAARRNCATNAMVHRGYRYTLSTDLRDWFGSVRREQLAAHVSAEVLDQILVDGAPRQGLPTSPAAANIAAAPMDARIVSALGVCGVYTRYADDLTVSSDDVEFIHEMSALIPQIAAEMGWEVHPRKTRIQCAAAGRRIVTGIAVDDALHPTRQTRRRLRAARHQGQVKASRGLAEWAKCKLPTGSRRVGAKPTGAAAPPATRRRVRIGAADENNGSGAQVPAL